MTTTFDRLLEPGRIGPVTTRNRMIKTGACTCFSHRDDVHMSEKAKAFYGALARGGVGLVIVESPIVDFPMAHRWKERYRIDEDRFVPGMTELVDTIHGYGCPTFLQFWHDGPWQSPLLPGPVMFEGPPIGASPVNILNAPNDFHRDVPRELTIPEIEDLVQKYVNAALRAQKAGFDGVDINAASSHLLHNFLSPFFNRREDAYGGTIEKRARLTTDIVREIKRLAGPDFAVIVLMNAVEVGNAVGLDDSKCLDYQQALQLAPLFENAGADAIQVRNHWLGYHVGGFAPDYLFYPEAPVPIDRFPKEYNWRMQGPGANVNYTAGIKATVNIPVIMVGRMDPELGEKYLEEGKADFIAMTRRLQADPELPNKVAAGKLDDVTPCMGCGNCLDRMGLGVSRTCRINAAFGTEEDYRLTKAPVRKKVVEVGGGPAGLEAARVAATRGHEVILIDKSRHLGGLMPLAALVKGSKPEDLPTMLDFYERQMKKLGVETKLGKPADVASIKALAPDVVIVATGGKLTVPDVPGVGGPNVVTAPQLHGRVKPFLNLVGPEVLDRLTRIWLPSVGKRVAVIGGGFQGLEVAEFLAKRGRKVTVLEPSAHVGEGVIDFRLGLLEDWFPRKGVDIITNAGDMKVTTQGVSYTSPDGKRTTVEADTVIPTAPVTPDTSLVTSLQGVVPEVYAIGDCREAGLMIDAIAAGWRVAKQI